MKKRRNLKLQVINTIIAFTGVELTIGIIIFGLAEKLF